MFHITVFAANEGEISPSDFTSVTFMGVAELKRPTMAQRIMRIRSERQRKRGWYERLMGRSRGLILTIFGITELQRPSLMEEYSAMRSLISSGAVTSAEFGQLLERLLAGGARDEWLTLTFFGACGEASWKREKQIKALNAGHNTGQLSSTHLNQLRGIIDAPVATSAALIGRLAMEPA
jgi:hypothetical protein